MKWKIEIYKLWRYCSVVTFALPALQNIVIIYTKFLKRYFMIGLRRRLMNNKVS